MHVRFDMIYCSMDLVLLRCKVNQGGITLLLSSSSKGNRMQCLIMSASIKQLASVQSSVSFFSLFHQRIFKHSLKLPRVISNIIY